ncbi:discoidin, CUB and LCCL domain-containing protein 1 [Chanos chanos]|uniref:Discoidin, CUB and LCCL domain-containing protein 1 n=1 Tax=Chanos chanos TaxID=29144 RepID=A0A6J2V4E2_CHACN|nr:discoidin, CUB and LCCL domain-containing protein 1 [Chanos chanos]
MSGNGGLYGIIFICSTLHTFLFAENLDDGCGHSVLGPESGVLSSKNYPGTYPNNSWCEKVITVPGGQGVFLRFGDLDIEGQDCESDYLKILKWPYGPEHVYGPFCGNLKSHPNLTVLYVDASEVTVQFRSSRHISGRGFLLTYSTGEHRDLLSCLDRGSHSSATKYRKYCPAGCGAVDGYLSGDVSEGYRHMSVLCKAAVHAGVILDELGGPITVEEHPGCSHYPAVRANGIQSKDGSLSDTLFTFVTNDCRRQMILHPAAISASSWWQEGGAGGGQVDWSPNRTHPLSTGGSWAADSSNRNQWLMLDLGEKRRITGIVTTGSTLMEFDFYVKKYGIEYKEKNRWKRYTQNYSTEETFFEGNLDNLHPSRSTFRPAIVARFLRVIPVEWHKRIGMRAELLGCPHSRAPPVNVTQRMMPTKPKPPPGTDITEPVPSHTDLVKLVVIIVPTVVCVLLLLVGICVYKTLHRKKAKENPYGSSDSQQTGCWRHMKQPFARHQSTEFTISYSPEKEPIQKLDLVTSVMAAEYQQPLMIGMDTVTRKGSTFRPMDTDTKADTNDPATHYDHLHTANQYALPLTNQEPEYATPIIERHTFRKDGFLSDTNYTVPGVVISKTPSFKTVESAGSRMVTGGFSEGYQTPQVKTDKRNHSEGVYDSPKISKPTLQNGGCSQYRRPQLKFAPPQESYSTPRDCVKLKNTACPRLDPEGSSSDGT